MPIGDIGDMVRGRHEGKITRRHRSHVVLIKLESLSHRRTYTYVYKFSKETTIDSYLVDVQIIQLGLLEVQHGSLRRLWP